MSQVPIILDALKRALKANGFTYAKVAELLDLSEASVKRLFSEQTFSVHRLESICGIMGLEIFDLLQMMESERRQLGELTHEQEVCLVNDKRLLLVAHLAINGWSYFDILQKYKFSEPELISYLIKLGKIGLIELLPMNRIKLRISRQFSWRSSGPVQLYFLKHFRNDFFNADFSVPAHELRVMSGMLSEESIRKLTERLHDFESQFIEQLRIDAGLPITQRSNFGCVLALRPWYAKLYDDLRQE